MRACGPWSGWSDDGPESSVQGSEVPPAGDAVGDDRDAVEPGLRRPHPGRVLAAEGTDAFATHGDPAPSDLALEQAGERALRRTDGAAHRERDPGAGAPLVGREGHGRDDLDLDRQ